MIVNHKLIRYVSFFYFLHSFFDTYEFFLLKFIYKNKISNYPSFPSPKFQHKKGLMNSYWFGNHVLIRYFIFFFAIISMIHFLYTLFLFWYIYEFFGTKFESIKVKRIQKNPVKFFSTIPNLNCKCIRPRVRSNCSPLDLKSDALSVWPRSLEVFGQEILWRCVSSYLGI